MSGDVGGALYITDSDGNLKVFNVKHDDDGRWLNGNYGNPENVWNSDNQFVFRNLLCSPPFRRSFLVSAFANPRVSSLFHLRIEIGERIA